MASGDWRVGGGQWWGVDLTWQSPIRPSFYMQHFLLLRLDNEWQCGWKSEWEGVLKAALEMQ